MTMPSTTAKRSALTRGLGLHLSQAWLVSLHVTTSVPGPDTGGRQRSRWQWTGMETLEREWLGSDWAEPERWSDLNLNRGLIWTWAWSDLNLKGGLIWTWAVVWSEPERWSDHIYIYNALYIIHNTLCDQHFMCPCDVLIVYVLCFITLNYPYNAQ